MIHRRLRLSFTAVATSCSDSKYRSVISTVECLSRNLTSSRPPARLRQSSAPVRRRYGRGPFDRQPDAACSTTDQMDQSPSSSNQLRSPTAPGVVVGDAKVLNKSAFRNYPAVLLSRSLWLPVQRWRLTCSKIGSISGIKTTKARISQQTGRPKFNV